MLPIIYIICGTISLLIIAWYIHFYRYVGALKNVQGPTPVPLLGSALEFKGHTSTLATFHKFFAAHGKIVKLMLGVEPVILLADYKAIESVLSSNKVLEKSDFYRFLYNWLNLGLLTASGPKWKSRRRLLTPAYHFQILEQFVPIFNRIGNVLIDEFKKAKDKDSVDVYPYVTLSTLDVICETAMGVSVNAQRNKHSPYVLSVQEMGRIVMDRSFRPIEQFEFTYQFTSNYRKEKECLKILHGHTMSVIEKRRNELMQNTDNEAGAQQDDFGTKKRVAFLDLLLKTKDDQGQPLSDQDIREEVDTFMFEGHDTTASGISFALYEIARHPDVQKKILEEQEDILAGEERDVTIQDLNQMKYLEMVIKETLRLYPSVPFFGRQTKDHVKLTDDVTISPGFTVFFVVSQIHRDPEYFPEPNRFDPDRFLPERNLGKHPYSFVPFSAGPRNCIGQKFAILEMKSTLSKMVRYFELLPTVPAHELDLTSETILKSSNGILIKIRQRK